MKKQLILAILSMAAWIQPMAAQFKINPKLGVSLSRLASDPENFETLARPGFSAGADVRLGKRVYFQPGLHFNVMNYELIDLKNDPQKNLKDLTGVKSIRIPVMLGLNLVDIKLFKMRVFGGVNYHQVTGVTNNNLGLTTADIKEYYWGAASGLGLDLLFLTIDVQYEWGQTAIFSAHPDTRYSTVALALGIKF